MYILEFWYRWPKVMSILRPPHYKSMGENWQSFFFFLDGSHYKHSSTLNYSYLWHTEHENGIRVPFLCPWGHLRSPMLSDCFSRMTFDRGVLEQWKHLSCVWLDETDRLICNLTLTSQVMSLTWGQIFKLTFQGQVIVHSTRLDERNTILVKRKFVQGLSQKLLQKTVSEKSTILAVFAPWRQNRWR